MKKLTATFIILAMATAAANAQRQDFFLPAYFNTNVFLADNTNTPLHTRIANAEATNASGWAAFAATADVDMDGNEIDNAAHLNLSADGSIRWGTGAADARPQIADGGGHLVFLATNKIIFSNDVIHAGSIDMDENSITNIDKLVGFGKTIDFDAGTLDGFALDAGVTNIGFGLTGDGQSTALAVDTNSVVTTGVLAAAYPRSNPSNFITAASLTGLGTDTMARAWAVAASNLAAAAYPASNPNQFIRESGLTNQAVLISAGPVTNSFTPGLAFSNIVIRAGNAGSDSAFAGSVVILAGAGRVASPSTGGDITLGAGAGGTIPGRINLFTAPGGMVNVNSGMISAPGGSNLVIRAGAGEFGPPVNGGNLILSGGMGGEAPGSIILESPVFGSAANLSNFPASILTVSAGNTNYWRITTAPASNSAFGSRGQIAVSSSNVFIYSENALGTGTGRWIRIPGDIAW